MTIKEQLTVDLKTAMLGGDKTLATTIRGLKSVILYAEVAKGNREVGLTDAEVIELFAKEAKKRQESADLYLKGESQERADAELAEKAIIEAYLPAQLSEADVVKIVDTAIADLGATDAKALGQVIGVVRAKTSGQADGSLIARLVKERLS